MLKRIHFALMLTLWIAGNSRAQQQADCEREWTFPVPFLQSLAWSPDGERLAISAVLDDWEASYGIYVLGADGTGLRRIESGGDRDLYPAWSPDGSRLAFSSRHDGNADVYSCAIDGSEMLRLTDDEAGDGCPSWSQDGSRIAFHSERDGNFEIYVMGSVGGEQTRLTEHAANDYNPAWSPDGKSLLFVSDALYSVDLESGSQSHIVPRVVYAVWSPDAVSIGAATYSYDEECKDHHALSMLDPASGTVERLIPLSSSNGDR